MKKTVKKNRHGINLILPNETIPHLCGHSGRCCWSGNERKGFSVSSSGLIPFDLWRIFCSVDKPLARYRIFSTGDLFDSKRGIAFLGLSSAENLPMCGLKMVPYISYKGETSNKAAMHCPFLVFDKTKITKKQNEKILDGVLPESGFWKINNKPRFYCILGNSKPIVCDTFPVGMYMGSEEETKTLVQFVCSLDLCKKCMGDDIGKIQSITLEEYIKHESISLYAKAIASYVYVVSKMKSMNTPNDIRLAITRTMFDFDTMILARLLEQEKLTKESSADEILKYLEDERPKNPFDLTMAGNSVLEMLNQSKQEEVQDAR